MTSGNGSPKRLPRFRRAAALSRCVLTPRDLDTLARVQSYRMLTSGQLQALVPGSGQGLLRRLQKLFHAGFLDRLLPRHVDGGGSARMVYAITNRGIRALQENGLLASASRTDWNAKNRSLHDLSIGHTLLVSQVRAVVDLACVKAGMRLLFWKEGSELLDRIEVALPEGYTPVPVAPDAFFAVQDAKGRMNFFLEADRGTMTVKRFVRKLQAYAAYYRDGRHSDKYGIKHFRVLTITTTPIRKSNLVSAARAEEGLAGLDRMFLFSAESQLSLENPECVLSAIWTTLARRETALVVQLPNNGTEVKK